MAPGPASLRVAVNADTLDTWFVGAMARFGREDETLLELAVDNEDHTADWLRRGRVLGAVTSIASAGAGLPQPAAGRAALRRDGQPGVRRAAGSPTGSTADALARAPSLVFDGKDGLQSQWVSAVLRRDVALPAHRVPSTQRVRRRGARRRRLGHESGEAWCARTWRPGGWSSWCRISAIDGEVIGMASARLPVPSLERRDGVVAPAAEARRPIPEARKSCAGPLTRSGRTLMIEAHTTRRLTWVC